MKTIINTFLEEVKTVYSQQNTFDDLRDKDVQMFDRLRQGVENMRQLDVFTNSEINTVSEEIAVVMTNMYNSRLKEIKEQLRQNFRL